MCLLPNKQNYGCACAENAGTFSPAPRVSDPDMHHGTCATHVPWCMPGSLTSGLLWIRPREGNVPGIPGACATRNFTYLVGGPWLQMAWRQVTRLLAVTEVPSAPLSDLELWWQWPNIREQWNFDEPRYFIYTIVWNNLLWYLKNDELAMVKVLPWCSLGAKPSPTGICSTRPQCVNVTDTYIFF